MKSRLKKRKKRPERPDPERLSLARRNLVALKRTKRITSRMTKNSPKTMRMNTLRTTKRIRLKTRTKNLPADLVIGPDIDGVECVRSEHVALGSGLQLATL